MIMLGFFTGPFKNHSFAGVQPKPFTTWPTECDHDELPMLVACKQLMPCGNLSEFDCDSQSNEAIFGESGLNTEVHPTNLTSH